jgi:hypothetical protein
MDCQVKLDQSFTSVNDYMNMEYPPTIINIVIPGYPLPLQVIVDINV